jgi:hypothetical protein
MAVFAALFAALLLARCGLDEYQYIAPVDDANVVSSSVYTVKFSLPTGGSVTLNFQNPGGAPTMAGGSSSFFDNYIIFYRIYLSNSMFTSTTESQYSSINPTMDSDYNAIEPYTVTTNNSASAGISIFTSRSFYQVDEDSAGGTLFRDKDNLPNALPRTNQWYFYYSSDLANTANITNNNMDVVSGSGTSYAWTMMYVIRKSFDPQTLQDIYSSPTFLGVFLLPTTINTTEIPLSSVSAAIGSALNTATITMTLGSSINGLDATNLNIEDTTTSTTVPDTTKATFSSVGTPATTDNKTFTFTITADSSTANLTGHTIQIAPTRSGYTFKPTYSECTVQ